MRKLVICLGVIGTAIAAYAPAAAAAREREPYAIESEDDSQSLASRDYRGYRPAWANPYAEPSDLGVNDDPTPFYPSDVDSGPSPFERGD
jgi:hypothetical protein